MKKIVGLFLCMAIIVSCFCGCDSQKDVAVSQWETSIVGIYRNDEGTITAIETDLQSGGTATYSVEKDDLRLKSEVEVGDTVLLSKHKDTTSGETHIYYTVLGLKDKNANEISEADTTVSSQND